MDSMIASAKEQANLKSVEGDFAFLKQVRSLCWGADYTFDTPPDLWVNFLMAFWALYDDKSPTLYYEPGDYAKAFLNTPEIKDAPDER